MIFIFDLSVELSWPTPAENYLSSTHITLLPPKDHSASPCYWLPSGVADFHHTACELIFILYSEIVYTVLYLRKPCNFILCIKSSNTNRWQVLGQISISYFSLAFCLLLYCGIYYLLWLSSTKISPFLWFQTMGYVDLPERLVKCHHRLRN